MTPEEYAKVHQKAFRCAFDFLNQHFPQITGFSDGELSELKSMEHYESKEALLSMLDRRNSGLGTMWLCGNGVYGLWYDNDAAYMNIGKSCD